jgi:hypothetical protein
MISNSDNHEDLYGKVLYSWYSLSRPLSVILTSLIMPPELPSRFIASETAFKQNAFAYSNDIPGL